MLHGMRVRQFTPRHSLPDIRTTRQRWKANPKVSIKHDDLYDRAREREYYRPFLDAENDNETPPTLPEIELQSDLSTEETWSTQGTARERSGEIFPQT